MQSAEVSRRSPFGCCEASGTKLVHVYTMFVLCIQYCWQVIFIVFTNNKTVCLHCTIYWVFGVSSVGVGQLLSHSTASLAPHADVNNPNSCFPDSTTPAFIALLCHLILSYESFKLWSWSLKVSESGNEYQEDHLICYTQKLYLCIQSSIIPFLALMVAVCKKIFFKDAPREQGLASPSFGHL